MLFLLLACGQSDPPAAAPAAPPPAEAPAETSATPPPPPAPPTPEAPDSAAPLATAQNPGHCAEGQHIWYECAVGQGRTVSLCGDAEPTWLQYHFGPPGASALSVPGQPAGLDRFRFAEQSWAQAQAQAVRFDNEDVTYLLVDKIGGGGPQGGAANNFQGVVVRKGEAELQRFPCAGQLEATGLPSLSGKLQALGYSD